MARTLVLLLAGATAGVALAGCGSSASTSGNSATATPIPTLTQDQFITITSQQSYASRMVSTASELRVAHAICNSFASGMDWVGVISTEVDNGFSADEAGNFTALSVHTFCPEQSSKLPAA